MRAALCRRIRIEEVHLKWRSRLIQVLLHRRRTGSRAVVASFDDVTFSARTDLLLIAWGFEWCLPVERCDIGEGMIAVGAVPPGEFCERAVLELDA